MPLIDDIISYFFLYLGILIIAYTFSAIFINTSTAIVVVILLLLLILINCLYVHHNKISIILTQYRIIDIYYNNLITTVTTKFIKSENDFALFTKSIISSFFIYQIGLVAQAWLIISYTDLIKSKDFQILHTLLPLITTDKLSYLESFLPYLNIISIISICVITLYIFRNKLKKSFDLIFYLIFTLFFTLILSDLLWLFIGLILRIVPDISYYTIFLSSFWALVIIYTFVWLIVSLLYYIFVIYKEEYSWLFSIIIICLILIIPMIIVVIYNYNNSSTSYDSSTMLDFFIKTYESNLLTINITIIIFLIGIPFTILQLRPYGQFKGVWTKRQAILIIAASSLALAPFYFVVFPTNDTSHLSPLIVLPLIFAISLYMIIISVEDTKPIGIIKEKFSYNNINRFFQQYTKTIEQDMKKQDKLEEPLRGLQFYTPIYRKTPPPLYVSNPYVFINGIAKLAIDSNDVDVYYFAIERSLEEDLKIANSLDEITSKNEIKQILTNYYCQSFKTIAKLGIENKTDTTYSLQLLQICSRFIINNLSEYSQKTLLLFELIFECMRLATENLLNNKDEFYDWLTPIITILQAIRIKLAQGNPNDEEIGFYISQMNQFAILGGRLENNQFLNYCIFYTFYQAIGSFHYGNIKVSKELFASLIQISRINDYAKNEVNNQVKIAAQTILNSNIIETQKKDWMEFFVNIVSVINGKNVKPFYYNGRFTDFTLTDID